MCLACTTLRCQVPRPENMTTRSAPSDVRTLCLGYNFHYINPDKYIIPPQNTGRIIPSPK